MARFQKSGRLNKNFRFKIDGLSVEVDKAKKTARKSAGGLDVLRHFDRMTAI